MASSVWSRRWNRWRCAPLWPAVTFLLLQVLNGMWFLTQLNFIPVFLQEGVRLSSSGIGVVIAGGQLTGMVTALVGGSLNARLGSKRMIIVGLLVASTSGFAFMLREPAMVAPLWFVGGVGLAMTTVGGASYLALLGGRGSLGMIAALYAIGMNVGGAIGNLAAGAIIESHGFLAFGVFQMAVIVLATMAAVVFLVEQGERPGVTLLRSFLSDALAITRRRRVQLLSGMRALPTIYYAMLNVLIPLLLNELTGSKGLVAAFGSVTLIIAATTQLLVGRAADRFGARSPTLICFTSLLIGALGLAFSTRVVWGLFLFGILSMTAAWSLTTLMYVWVADGVEPADRASVFGLLHAVWSISAIIGSLLAGVLSSVARALPFVVALFLCAGALVLTRIYYCRTRAGAPTTGKASGLS